MSLFTLLHLGIIGYLIITIIIVVLGLVYNFLLYGSVAISLELYPIKTESEKNMEDHIAWVNRQNTKAQRKKHTYMTIFLIVITVLAIGFTILSK